MIEPTIGELCAAFYNCALSSTSSNQHGKPTNESLQKLAMVRYRKMTWVGQEENQLRVKIDRYLWENNF